MNRVILALTPAFSPYLKWDAVLHCLKATYLLPWDARLIAVETDNRTDATEFVVESDQFTEVAQWERGRQPIRILIRPETASNWWAEKAGHAKCEKCGHAQLDHRNAGLPGAGGCLRSCFCAEWKPA